MTRILLSIASVMLVPFGAAAQGAAVAPSPEAAAVVVRSDEAAPVLAMRAADPTTSATPVVRVRLAQGATPLPPPAPPAPLPPSSPVAPAPPAPPAPPTVLRLRMPTPMNADAITELEKRLQALNESIAGMDEASRQAKEEALRGQIDELRRQAQDSARAVEDAMREKTDAFRQQLDDARAQQQAMMRDQMALDGPPFLFAQRGQNGPVIFSNGNSESGLYNTGLSALQQRQYDRAITAFDRVVAQKGTRADGALYWKAFAQMRLARTEDAVATTTQLRRDYPQSRYLNDARVLEVEARKVAGQPLTQEDMATSEEIKILAIQAMQRTDPERAVPLLEGVLSAANSLAIKKQAIYVLALSEDPRAHQTLLRYAKGGGNPDLQSESIRYLASRRDKQTTGAELKEIYESSSDPSVRRAIIEAFSSTGDKAALVNVANSSTASSDLRRSAIAGLANLGAPTELWALFQKEQDKDLRLFMTGSFSSMGAVDQLAQIAKTDKEPSVRQRAIAGLGNQKIERTGSLLVDLYGSESDKDTKRAVIQALARQDNADALVTLGRKEKSLDMQVEIVKKLTDQASKSKAASDYLMDLASKP